MRSGLHPMAEAEPPRESRMNFIPVSIEDLPSSSREEADHFLKECPLSPAARLRPRLGKNGDIWVALLGSSVREGKVGFGPTPVMALRAFNRNFGRLSEPSKDPSEADMYLEVKRIRTLLEETENLLASALRQAAKKQALRDWHNAAKS